MNIRDWRIDARVSQRELALRLGISGANPARTLQRYESGESQMSSVMVDRLEAVTKSAVTAQDMHETRLEWLRVNKPNEFTTNLSDEVTA